MFGISIRMIFELEKHMLRMITKISERHNLNITFFTIYYFIMSKTMTCAEHTTRGRKLSSQGLFKSPDNRFSILHYSHDIFLNH
jgi:hypothetical protein